MIRQQRPITDRELRAWLAAGAVDRGVGEGLTFVASATAAQAGKASWILRYRLNGRSKEKVLGRHPELSLRDARERVRQDRAQIERGIDVAAAKQAEKALILEVPTVQRLGEAWLKRYIQPRYKHPEVVARVLRKHINPVLGPMAPPGVQQAHVDRVLTRIVAGGALEVRCPGVGRQVEGFIQQARQALEPRIGRAPRVVVAHRRDATAERPPRPVPAACHESAARRRRESTAPARAVGWRRSARRRRDRRCRSHLRRR